MFKSYTPCTSSKDEIAFFSFRVSSLSALSPSIISAVFLSISTPVLIIITLIITPKYPSKLIFHMYLIIAATNVENETMESINASSPVPIKLSEFTFLPTFLTYFARKNFTIIATAITTKDTIS